MDPPHSKSCRSLCELKFFLSHLDHHKAADGADGGSFCPECTGGGLSCPCDTSCLSCNHPAPMCAGWNPSTPTCPVCAAESCTSDFTSPPMGITNNPFMNFSGPSTNFPYQATNFSGRPLGCPIHPPLIPAACLSHKHQYNLAPPQHSHFDLAPPQPTRFDLAPPQPTRFDLAPPQLPSFDLAPPQLPSFDLAPPQATRLDLAANHLLQYMRGGEDVATRNNEGTAQSIFENRLGKHLNASQLGINSKALYEVKAPVSRRVDVSFRSRYARARDSPTSVLLTPDGYEHTAGSAPSPGLCVEAATQTVARPPQDDSGITGEQAGGPLQEGGYLLSKSLVPRNTRQRQGGTLRGADPQSALQAGPSSRQRKARMVVPPCTIQKTGDVEIVHFEVIIEPQRTPSGEHPSEGLPGCLNQWAELSPDTRRGPRDIWMKVGIQCPKRREQIQRDTEGERPESPVLRMKAVLQPEKRTRCFSPKGGGFNDMNILLPWTQEVAQMVIPQERAFIQNPQQLGDLYARLQKREKQRCRWTLPEEGECQMQYKDCFQEDFFGPPSSPFSPMAPSGFPNQQFAHPSQDSYRLYQKSKKAGSVRPPSKQPTVVSGGRGVQLRKKAKEQLTPFKTTPNLRKSDSSSTETTKEKDQQPKPAANKRQRKDGTRNEQLPKGTNRFSSNARDNRDDRDRGAPPPPLVQGGPPGYGTTYGLPYGMHDCSNAPLPPCPDSGGFLGTLGRLLLWMSTGECVSWKTSDPRPCLPTICHDPRMPHHPPGSNFFCDPRCFPHGVDRQGTPFSDRPGTPFSDRPGTPFSDRPGTPFSDRPGTPFSSDRGNGEERDRGRQQRGLKVRLLDSDESLDIREDDGRDKVMKKGLLKKTQPNPANGDHPADLRKELVDLKKEMNDIKRELQGSTAGKSDIAKGKCQLITFDPTTVSHPDLFSFLRPHQEDPLSSLRSWCTGPPRSQPLKAITFRVG
ncbi:unnamed protein product [Cyprideis torosa]|uniref:Uncharacterized protein n=1 Tax=Cyprideis torosa TaxID=163714 RepID=A0A7R8ZS31_9CRUS|nr:unnamed protein product [Cyprideis torosa]CAG0894564.1 unnamed protein product [Cyprideis torosa]